MLLARITPRKMKSKISKIKTSALLMVGFSLEEIAELIGVSLSALEKNAICNYQRVKLSNLYEKEVLKRIDKKRRGRQILEYIESKIIRNDLGVFEKVKFFRLNTNTRTYSIANEFLTPGNYISESDPIIKGTRKAFDAWDMLPAFSVSNYKSALRPDIKKVKSIPASSPAMIAIRSIVNILIGSVGLSLKEIGSAVGREPGSVRKWIIGKHGINKTSYKRLISYVKEVIEYHLTISVRKALQDALEAAQVDDSAFTV